MTAAADLYALQEIDLALDRAVDRLGDIEPQLGESEELMEARAVVKEKQQLVSGFRSRQSDLEWSVDEVREKASSVEKKLYGGTVRNPKELEDLQADLNSLRAQTRSREDTLLALLVEIEDAESALRGAEAAWTEVETTWLAGQQGLRAEKERLEPEVARLRARRDAQAATIDRASLNLYDMLRPRRGGQAVAKAEQGMCQGCRITLPVSVLQKARTGTNLVQCVSCERILLVS